MLALLGATETNSSASSWLFQRSEKLPCHSSACPPPGKHPGSLERLSPAALTVCPASGAGDDMLGPPVGGPHGSDPEYGRRSKLRRGLTWADTGSAPSQGR